MSFIPDYKLSELSKMAGFNTVDELAMYACTTRQNLDNWNKTESKQGFLRVVIMGAKVMKAQEIKRQANARAMRAQHV
ncbi:hypothetical protein [Vibrio owensii]|uniref:hypothetical protein n=1 Tax=Vibrio owensii TaxID=696485 RepID=UPI0005EEE8CE|nr:hypothetical protein [Vibrio owensii]